VAAFSPVRLAGYCSMAADLFEERAAAWGDSIDLYREMHGLALDVLLRSMLGLDRASRAYDEFCAHYWPLIMRVERSVIPLRRRMPARRAKPRMWALLERLAVNPREDSALRCLRDARDAGVFGDEELVRYAYMLTDFGHGDLAILLTYALAASSRTEYRERIAAEMSSAGARAADEATCPFTSAFVREVERRYPPVTELHRLAAEDFEFAGFRIPKDTYVFSAVDLLFRTEEYFRAPQVFDPARFLPPRNEGARPYTLVPFGIGRHMCVAAKYSRAIVTEVVSRYAKKRYATTSPLPAIDYRRTLQAPAGPVIALARHPF